MNKIILLILIFCSVSIFSQDKNQQENFIDVAESKCFDKKEITNAQMLECSIKAGQSWDKILQSSCC